MGCLLMPQQLLVNVAAQAFACGDQRRQAQGLVTGASGRNWSGYSDRVQLASSLGESQRAVLTDPQTSGGLLVACAPQACEEVLRIFREEGFGNAAVIGEFADGPAQVSVA